MIIDGITLEDFGVFGGRHELVLTPRPGKPIILLGALNGGGKTTLLEAIQLALYGRRARSARRGRTSFAEYIKERLHRNGVSSPRASITLRFRRAVAGTYVDYELSRSWELSPRGVDEWLRVLCGGVEDESLADHWDDEIDAFLPAGIAHLFFFDGEQIEELAEGRNAGAIIGTAMINLLGIQVLDRLETDLRNFERKKQAESRDTDVQARIAEASNELERIDRDQSDLASEEGRLRNELGRMEKCAQDLDQKFRALGGEIYLRRRELDEAVAKARAERAARESSLRDLINGVLPFSMVAALLDKVADQARRDVTVLNERVVLNELAKRDGQILDELVSHSVPPAVRSRLAKYLKADIVRRERIAKQNTLFENGANLLSSLESLKENIAGAGCKGRSLVREISACEQQTLDLEVELGRIPTSETIDPVIEELTEAKVAISDRRRRVDEVRERILSLQRLRTLAESKLDKLGLDHIEDLKATEDVTRMMKHSRRVRDSLDQLRSALTRRHLSTIESLVLESLHQLLEKPDLVTEFHLEAETFEPVLLRRDGIIQSDQLSAGERQLLATSILWGLARASGRPVPTIIDTPLGRLDSKHRARLVERYFPFVSHQVLLLSTDEEIRGATFERLRPYVSHSYLLTYDSTIGSTAVTRGYF